MGRPLDLHADVERVATVGGLPIIATGIAPPSDGSAGYAEGCLFIDTVGAAVYINEGTVTSCDFDAITTA